MSLNLNEEKKEESKFEKKDLGRIADGTYIAIVNSIIDLGRQVETDWKTGEVLKWDDGNDKILTRVWITFEYPTERVEYEDQDGNITDAPRILGKKYTVSLHEKAGLTKLFDAANTEPKSMADLVGKVVMTSVGSTSGGKAKITSTSKLMKGITPPEPELEPLVFDLDNFDENAWKRVPKFLQEMIKEGPDFDMSLLDGVDEEDVPF